MVLDRGLTDLVSGKSEGMLSEMPPRHGKSELLGRYTPPWFIGTFPEKRVIYISYGDNQARKFGRRSRDVFESVGEELWGLRVKQDSHAAHSWEVEGHDGGMETTGIGGPITGKGAHLLIIDDPFKNEKEAASELIRDNTWDWLHATALSRLEPDGVVVINATRWHMDDLHGRARESGLADKWINLSFPAIAGDDDQLGRKPGEALWPERYPIEKLLRIKERNPLYWWQCLYQQHPVKHEGVTWDESHFNWPGFWFSQWPSPSRVVFRVIALDPSQGKSDKVGDYSAFVALAATEDGDFWVEANMARRSPGKIVTDGVDFIQEFKPHAFAVEGNAWQFLLGEMFNNELAARRLTTEVFTIDNSINKDIRIKRADPYLRGRTIHFRDTPMTRLLVNQLSEHPMARHDDGPDAMEMAIRMLGYLASGDVEAVQGMGRVVTV